MQIIFENVDYLYNDGTAFEQHAIKDVNFAINQGDYVGIIGHTGSGKSTLIQLMNGLIKATKGNIYYNGESIYDKGYNFKNLRSKVGLVFQYPEHQLFETTILKDVIYGPNNLGLSKEESYDRAVNALSIVGIKEDLFDASPFELSGGQKRRVAIAGVLAMKPELLILDEPTAGLDPKGRDDILEQIDILHKNTNITIMLVSHRMEDVSRYANRVLVMNKGSLMMDQATRQVFSQVEKLEEIGLAAPQVVYIINELRKAGYNVPGNVMTIEEAKEAIMKLLRSGGRNDT